MTATSTATTFEAYLNHDCRFERELDEEQWTCPAFEGFIFKISRDGNKYDINAVTNPAKQTAFTQRVQAIKTEKAAGRPVTDEDQRILHVDDMAMDLANSLGLKYDPTNNSLKIEFIGAGYSFDDGTGDETLKYVSGKEIMTAILEFIHKYGITDVTADDMASPGCKEHKTAEGGGGWWLKPCDAKFFRFHLLNHIINKKYLSWYHQFGFEIVKEDLDEIETQLSYLDSSGITDELRTIYGFDAKTKTANCQQFANALRMMMTAAGPYKQRYPYVALAALKYLTTKSAKIKMTVPGSTGRTGSTGSKANYIGWENIDNQFWSNSHGSNQFSSYQSDFQSIHESETPYQYQSRGFGVLLPIILLILLMCLLIFICVNALVGIGCYAFGSMKKAKTTQYDLV